LTPVIEAMPFRLVLKYFLVNIYRIEQFFRIGPNTKHWFLPVAYGQRPSNISLIYSVALKS